MHLTTAPPRQATDHTVLATFELDGLHTHDREPGSEELDDVVNCLGDAIVDVVTDDYDVQLLYSSVITVVGSVAHGHEQNLRQAVVTALTDRVAGVRVTDSSVVELFAAA